MSGWIAAAASSSQARRTASEKRLDVLVLVTVAGIAVAIGLFYYLVIM